MTTNAGNHATAPESAAPGSPGDGGAGGSAAPAGPVNPVREAIDRGDVALGLNVRLARSGEIAAVARGTGHCFLYIDAQHAPYNLETMAQLAQVSLGYGVAPIVRVRSWADPNIPVLLDAGVTGIVVPDTETPEQAAAVVRACKFAPVGQRSLGGLDIHYDYGPAPAAELMARLNQTVLVIAMIETVAGLAQTEAIAAVPGVDSLYLGGNDMLASMGKSGQYDDPEVYQALDRVIAAARVNGLFAGCGGLMGTQRQADVISRGVRFLTTTSDLGLVRSGAARALTELRAAVGPLPARSAL
jgi:staphyloferrin B biosynthesis citrate synthase